MIEGRYGLVRLSDMYRDPLCQGEKAICFARVMGRANGHLDEPHETPRSIRE